MLSDFYKSIPFLLALAGSALANPGETYITNVSSKGVGCTARVASSSIGFNAFFYSYPVNHLTYPNTWMENNFQQYGLTKSTTGVTEPNFTFGYEASTASLYGFQNINVGLMLWSFWVTSLVCIFYY